MSDKDKDKDSSFVFELKINIPFSSPREAEIIYEVLRVDAEPRRNFVKKHLEIVNGNILQVTFKGDIAKHIRVGVSSFFDSLLLCCETIKLFGPPAEKYSHYI